MSTTAATPFAIADWDFQPVVGDPALVALLDAGPLPSEPDTPATVALVGAKFANSHGWAS